MLMDFLGKDTKDRGVVISGEDSPVAGTGCRSCALYTFELCEGSPRLLPYGYFLYAWDSFLQGFCPGSWE